jgi:NAD(P)-dependent dehydrogenase (short-subunit alcohol dehydrogenase family)
MLPERSIAMDLQLKGKVALVTGGSIGIGRAVAEAFAAEGAHVAVCARNEARVRQAAQAIGEAHGVSTIGVAADVTKEDDLEGFVAQAADGLGGVDILVNNAGTGSEETIMEAPDERWQYYWELHVMAAVRLARLVVPKMRGRGGGVIINNASICAKQPLYYEPIYNTTKAALAMFSKCLANEVIGDNIRVNTVNPGLIRTPDWDKTAGAVGAKEGITADAYLKRIAEQNTPIGRFASPEELAAFFVFLASPVASYCVGSTYYVDGGWLKVVD